MAQQYTGVPPPPPPAPGGHFYDMPLRQSVQQLPMASRPVDVSQGLSHPNAALKPAYDFPNQGWQQPLANSRAFDKALAKDKSPKYDDRDGVEEVYEGYTFERVETNDKKQRTWAVAERMDIPFSSPQLAKEVKRRMSKTDVPREYSGLSSNQKVLIDRLLEEKKSLEMNQQAVWSIESVHRTIIRVDFWSRETKTLEVIIRRTDPLNTRPRLDKSKNSDRQPLTPKSKSGVIIDLRDRKVSSKIDKNMKTVGKGEDKVGKSKYTTKDKKEKDLQDFDHYEDWIEDDDDFIEIIDERKPSMMHDGYKQFSAAYTKPPQPLGAYGINQQPSSVYANLPQPDHHQQMHTNINKIAFGQPDLGRDDAQLPHGQGVGSQLPPNQGFTSQSQQTQHANPHAEYQDTVRQPQSNPAPQSFQPAVPQKQLYDDFGMNTPFPAYDRPPLPQKAAAHLPQPDTWTPDQHKPRVPSPPMPNTYHDDARMPKPAPEFKDDAWGSFPAPQVKDDAWGSFPVATSKSQKDPFGLGLHSDPWNTNMTTPFQTDRDLNGKHNLRDANAQYTQRPTDIGPNPSQPSRPQDQRPELNRRQTEQAPPQHHHAFGDLHTPPFKEKFNDWHASSNSLSYSEGSLEDYSSIFSDNDSSSATTNGTSTFASPRISSNRLGKHAQTHIHTHASVPPANFNQGKNHADYFTVPQRPSIKHSRTTFGHTDIHHRPHISRHNSTHDVPSRHISRHNSTSTHDAGRPHIHRRDSSHTSTSLANAGDSSIGVGGGGKYSGIVAGAAERYREERKAREMDEVAEEAYRLGRAHAETERR